MHILPRLEGQKGLRSSRANGKWKTLGAGALQGMGFNSGIIWGDNWGN